MQDWNDLQDREAPSAVPRDAEWDPINPMRSMASPEPAPSPVVRRTQLGVDPGSGLYQIEDRPAPRPTENQLAAAADLNAATRHAQFVTSDRNRRSIRALAEEESAGLGAAQIDKVFNERLEEEQKRAKAWLDAAGVAIAHSRVADTMLGQSVGRDMTDSERANLELAVDRANRALLRSKGAGGAASAALNARIAYQNETLRERAAYHQAEIEIKQGAGKLHHQTEARQTMVLELKTYTDNRKMAADEWAKAEKAWHDYEGNQIGIYRVDKEAETSRLNNDADNARQYGVEMTKAVVQMADKLVTPQQMDVLQKLLQMKADTLGVRLPPGTFQPVSEMARQPMWDPMTAGAVNSALYAERQRAFAPVPEPTRPELREPGSFEYEEYGGPRTTEEMLAITGPAGREMYEENMAGAGGYSYMPAFGRAVSAGEMTGVMPEFLGEPGYDEDEEE